MHSSDLSVSPAPYGLAFAIDELVRLRQWAEQRRLTLSIALDCTMEGTEFEELLIVAPAGSARRTLTVWRTREGVVAQTPNSGPRQFATMQELLSQVRPVRPRRAPWLARLGLG